LADLGDDEIVDDAHSSKKKTSWSGQYGDCSWLGDLDETEVHDADYHDVEKE
jgi:hypothetical protein